MIERVAIAVLVFLVLFFGGALLLPRSIQVERSIEIDRPVLSVFTVVNRFDAFPAWSPWSYRDPDVSYRVSGPSSGPGAGIDWKGDPRLVGQGRMAIIESRPNSLVRYALEIDGRRSAEARMQIVRKAGGARITWTFNIDLVAGQGVYSGLMSRYFGLLVERWIGPDFEQALVGLKQYLESLPAADYSGLEVGLERVEPVDVLFIRLSDGRGLTERMAGAYHDISAFMSAHGIEPTGEPIALKRSTAGGRYSFEAAIPALPGAATVDGHIRRGRTPGGEVVRALHRGDYSKLDATYQKLAAWMATRGLARAGISWEQYVSDPSRTPDEERATQIYVLLKDRE